MSGFPDPLVGPRVRLRAFVPADAAMARELSTDPYVPLTGSLPAHADAAQAAAWVRRQQGRLAEGAGYSFALEVGGRAVGQCGLWFAGPDRFTVGYAVVPGARGQGLAAEALGLLVGFAWTHPAARTVEALVEPWNTASLRTVVGAGFARAGTTTHLVGGEERDVEVWVVTR